MKKYLYIATIALLLVAFGVSAFMVGSYLLESKQQEEKFDQLAQMVGATESSAAEQTDPSSADPEQTLPEETTAPTEDPTKGMYDALYEMNSDIVGWIQIHGTELNYPVMQTEVGNENFYLERDFEGNVSKHGCIYADEECDVNKPSDNITMYGHNMKDGSMFAALNAYVEKSAWEYNPTISFNTLTEIHDYKIFAVFRTTATLGKGFNYHQFIDAANEEEFNEFVATCKQLAYYETGETPVYGDKLICLSTCEYTHPDQNGRLVVAAYRIT